MPIDGSTVLVNLHCHSDRSDGELSPALLAERLAAAGARYAALTDHDTVEGLAEFRAALLGRGVGAVDGVEITAASAWGELHILGYGFDPAHPGLLAFLEDARRRTDDGVQGFVDTLKRIRQAAGARPVEEAIGILHAAGGAAFLAHPLSYGLGENAVEEAVRALKAAGLDGLEAVYGPYAPEERSRLADMASVMDLAVSAGSDCHGPGIDGGMHPAVAMNNTDWTRFRGLLLRSPKRPARADGRRPRRKGAGAFAARIIAPALTAMALFILSIFAVMLPSFERILLDRKKDMIRELANSAVSILREYASEEAAGRLSRTQAQGAAAARIRDLRYGAEGKDYFWITDMRPVMIVHPYRPELDGTNVAGYADADGVRVFVEFVNAVRDKEEGYVEYLWQWMDDSHRIVPKLSFVKRFPAWDWIVGTGIYIDDVNAEIQRVTASLIRLSAGIAAGMALLLLIVVQQSHAIEHRRRKAESALRDSHERYRALVEAAQEGLVVVIGGACSYANPTFLSMLGCTEEELSLLGISEILRPYPGAEAEARAFVESLDSPHGSRGAGVLEAILIGRDGRETDVVLKASGLEIGGRAGTILIARDVGAAAPAPGGSRAFPAVRAMGMGRARLLSFLRGLESSGAEPRSLGRILTSASDVIVECLVGLAVADLGEPPSAFAFLALGSEGRGEHLPGSDQDNAIVFMPGSDDGARSYFLRLGERVCGWLNDIGVPYCTGGIMAMNRSWCATLEEWRDYFTSWIRAPEPRELLAFNTFFDLRCVTGDAELSERLLSQVRELLAENPPFFLHHARDQLDRRLPAFPKDGELDAKLAMAPIVSFARLYALRHGVRAMNTLERLESLRKAEVLDHGSLGGAMRAFELFMRLRIRAQLSGHGNKVEVSSLSPGERDMLGEAIASLGLLRMKIGWDFLGTVL
jgi:CBS domain-containing protein